MQRVNRWETFVLFAGVAAWQLQRLTRPRRSSRVAHPAVSSRPVWMPQARDDEGERLGKGPPMRQSHRWDADLPARPLILTCSAAIALFDLVALLPGIPR